MAREFTFSIAIVGVTGIQTSTYKVDFGRTKTHRSPRSKEFCVKGKCVSSWIGHVVGEYDALGSTAGHCPDFQRGRLAAGQRPP